MQNFTMKCLDLCDLVLILIRFSCLNLYFRISIFFFKSISTLETSTCMSSYKLFCLSSSFLDYTIKTWISDKNTSLWLSTAAGLGGSSQLDYEFLTHIILRIKPNIQEPLSFP